MDYPVINFSLQIVGLQSIIYFHSVPLTNNIQTHSSTPISHMDDIKMVRRCKDLLKNRKTFLTNYIQEKNHTYQHVQRSSSIPTYPRIKYVYTLNILLKFQDFPGHIHLKKLDS